MRGGGRGSREGKSVDKKLKRKNEKTKTHYSSRLFPSAQSPGSQSVVAPTTEISAVLK
jgi:hypothetical protein